MDITTLAAWGEFIGGIAVVVSLIYLASQIRQNSRLLRASTASATMATNNDFSSLVVQDLEVARIFREGRADRSSLSDDDLQRFDSLLGMAFTAQNQEYQFVTDGVMGRSSGWQEHWRASLSRQRRGEAYVGSKCRMICSAKSSIMPRF